MERQEDEKGTVVIRTLFGEVSVAAWFPEKTLVEGIADEPWHAAAGAEGGAFCYTDDERLMPL